VLFWAWLQGYDISGSYVGMQKDKSDFMRPRATRACAEADLDQING